MNDVAVSSWVSAILATSFLAALIARLPRLIQGIGNLWLWLTHLGMALVLSLAVDPVYEFVDSLAGSHNFANLVSHIGIALVFFCGGIQISHGINRPEIASKILKLSTVALPASAALMGVLFVFSGSSYSDVGLNAFRDNPLVVLYKLALYIYPAIVSSFLVAPLMRAATESVSRIPYYSKKLMGFGFGLVIAAPLGHLAELANRQLGWITDLFIYPAIFSVLVGMTLGLVDAVLCRRQQRRDFIQAS